MRGRRDNPHRKLVLGIALVAVTAAAFPAIATAATARTRATAPKATEVGVTGTEIHIAVIADVDNSLAPNLFLTSRDAVEGFARYVNTGCALKNRCLAGRKLVVDFYDSHLNANDTRDDEITACADDFAMVGTSATSMTTVDDMRNCKDQAGASTGIPDIPFVATEVAHECSDESFPIAPPTLQCNTKDQHPQSWDANVARGYYFTHRYGALHGVYIFPTFPQAARVSALATLGGLRDVGGSGKAIRSDRDFDLQPNVPQSAYTPIAQTIKDKGSNYAQCAKEFACTVALRQEAKLQGVTDQVKVWDCGASCYDKGFVRAGGADVDGEYVDTLFLPFYDAKEQQAVPMLANFVKYTGTDKVDGLGVYAWSAAVAFRDAVNSVVKAHGVDGLTRANLFAALNQIHTFDADGMLAPIDLAGRRISDCHVLTQVRHGTFVRVQPTTPGKFDCNRKYVITRKLDLLTSP